MMISNWNNNTTANTTTNDSSYAFGYGETSSHGSGDSYYQSYFYQRDLRHQGVNLSEPVPQVVPIDDGLHYESSEHGSEDSWYIPGEQEQHNTTRKLSNHFVHKRSAPTKSIAMPASHIPRTYSEIKLSEDTQAAEWRDYCMYRRVQAKLVHSAPCGADQFNLNRGALAKLEERHRQDLTTSAHVVSDHNSHSCSSEIDDEDFDGDVFSMDM
mmetsp:Transcript_22042/g.33662  ORF Transcript_22042/g.33662 Transcript_22042/m.33662 type:complete len:212 (-) Transcript_22042:153-788(-)|eukprot:CAMPEP_0196811406 /NCGR_PEP_ID=MMETSP1362-20130617/17219_1 /TAXON_ID=163516 /ORGANISM="Leptocylindrus danicus, Strain CCMP1856" /LENGTH=211 /DNA_ID=CAMNT_0042186693 /DNA_START=88 /DNA_END=723 /DNA_ORIENTATION=+